MQISPVDSFSRKISVAAIAGYQKHISPHKGFACAHRLLYGGESCSGYIKRVIAEEGLIAAWVKSHDRFQACKQANLTLQAAKEKRRLLQMENLDPLEEPDIEIDDDEPSKRSQRQSSSCGNSANSSSNCSDCADIPDCSFLDCSSADFHTPDCSHANCHIPDCSGADCGSLDCGGADCSFLDCGGCGN